FDAGGGHPAACGKRALRPRHREASAGASIRTPARAVSVAGGTAGRRAPITPGWVRSSGRVAGTSCPDRRLGAGARRDPVSGYQDTSAIDNKLPVNHVIHRARTLHRRRWSAVAGGPDTGGVPAREPRLPLSDRPADGNVPASHASPSFV